MTDRELVEKKLALLVGYVTDLQRLARLDLLRSDLRERRFVEHTLQLATQVTLDVASHVVSDEALGEPATNRDLFNLLARGGFIEGDLAERLELMAGFRNILVHGYAEVDLAVVEDIVRHRLDDLLRFARAIQRRL